MRNLLFAMLVIFFPGCMSTTYFEYSDKTKQDTMNYATDDYAELKRRWGDFADAAGHRYSTQCIVGISPFERDAICSYEFEWLVNGVVLQANLRAWPKAGAGDGLDSDHTYTIQWNPLTDTLDFYDHAFHDKTWLGVVQTDGSILKRRGYWEKTWSLKENIMSSTITNHPDATVKEYHFSDGANFEKIIAEWQEIKRQRAADDQESSREFWSSVSQGLHAASTQLQAESEAQQLRDAEMRSAIMRSKDAELRSMGQHLAEQQLEAEWRQQHTQERVAEPSLQNSLTSPSPQQQTLPAGPKAHATSSHAKPLRFMLIMPLKDPIDMKNAFCRSNVIQIPGPSSWGSGWPNANDARRLILPYRQKFEEKCRAFGPSTRSEAIIHWNDPDDRDLEWAAESYDRSHNPLIRL